MRQRTDRQLLIGVGTALFVLVWPFVLGRRVPLLGWADLGFHELGHMLATPLGETIHFLAGSTTQVLVPLGLAVYFWVTQRDSLATGIVLAWAASSFQDASVYIADAPYQRLQLIGGRHDWSFLLGRWHLIDQADTIASFVWFVGLVIGLFGLWVLVEPMVTRRSRRVRNQRLQERFASAPVREIRNPDPAPPSRSDPAG